MAQAAPPERLETRAQRRLCRDRAPHVEVMRGAPVRGHAPAGRGEEICRGRASLNPYLARQMSDLWVPMDLCSSTGLKASLPTKISARARASEARTHTRFTQVQATVDV